jgi:DNA-directed RNA polymerase subunit N (RpoN/RPB10)
MLGIDMEYLLPVRCYTCGTVLQEEYLQRYLARSKQIPSKEYILETLRLSDEEIANVESVFAKVSSAFETRLGKLIKAYGPTRVRNALQVFIRRASYEEAAHIRYGTNIRLRDVYAQVAPLLNQLDEKYGDLFLDVLDAYAERRSIPSGEKGPHFKPLPSGASEVYRTVVDVLGPMIALYGEYPVREAIRVYRVAEPSELEPGAEPVYLQIVEMAEDLGLSPGDIYLIRNGTLGVPSRAFFSKYFGGITPGLVNFCCRKSVIAPGTIPIQREEKEILEGKQSPRREYRGERAPLPGRVWRPRQARPTLPPLQLGLGEIEKERRALAKQFGYPEEFVPPVTEELPVKYLPPALEAELDIGELAQGGEFYVAVPLSALDTYREVLTPEEFSKLRVEKDRVMVPEDLYLFYPVRVTVPEYSSGTRVLKAM